MDLRRVIDGKDLMPDSIGFAAAMGLVHQLHFGSLGCRDMQALEGNLGCHAPCHEWCVWLVRRGEADFRGFLRSHQSHRADGTARRVYSQPTRRFSSRF